MPLDPAYQTVAPDDFPAMLEPARYARRTPHFEEIIARTEEHFWNPEDRDYINFDQPWPAGEPLLPLSFIVEGLRDAIVFGFSGNTMLDAFLAVAGIALFGLVLSARALRHRLRTGA